MAYRYEVELFSEPEKFYGNALVFATSEEADDAGRYKFNTWTLVNRYRVVETTDAPNYTWIGNGMMDEIKS